MAYKGRVRPTIALTAADIAADAVGSSEIADDAVTADKLANSINTEIAANTAKVTNATHTGDVTGATALTIATDAVDIAMLSATGTASSSTFLRGDNAWAAAGGDNTPAFQAYISGNVSITNDTGTKITFDTEDFDTDGAYDNSTNYRFTVPTDKGGKYFFSAHTIIGATASSKFNYGYQYIHLNGSGVAWSAVELRANPGEYITLPSTVILTLVPTDYVEVFCWTFTTDASAGRSLAHLRGSRFTGFKMIGL